MARGLDHIVHAVRNLDAAVEFYRHLGFTVGARNVHPRTWGTENHIVQLPGTFIELLTVTDESGIIPHATRHFSFGAFNRDWLAREQGFSMLALEGRGAPDSKLFQEEGIGDFELYEFEREAKHPDGRPVKVKFALAFASNPNAPDIGFFTSLQHNPENFWNPAFQTHANTAKAVAGVVLVAQEPAAHASFLSSLAGVESQTTANGVMTKTPRGDIEVLKPAVFVERFGVVAPDISHGARLAAVRFSVGDASLFEGVPNMAGLSGLYAGNATVIGPQDALGAVLVFEPSR